MRTFIWEVETANPVAVDSFDHMHPFGTASDNHRSDEFCSRLCSLLRTSTAPSVLDIGCAGGGMVADMWAQGWDAIGIEGSDYSQKAKRAEWEHIDGVCLFTCDATKPFTVKRRSEDGSFQALFQVITAWEVLEHIEESDLLQFFWNVLAHLAPSGYFICSIASFPSPHDGIELHRTLRPPEWWEDRLFAAGLVRDHDAEAHFEGNWVRTGSANFVLKRRVRP
jgi:2-polyprenyl-3-methyl-5-hydroxy-6-metoxy-1,4-benzoquinol methylase